MNTQKETHKPNSIPKLLATIALLAGLSVTAQVPEPRTPETEPLPFPPQQQEPIVTDEVEEAEEMDDAKFIKRGAKANLKEVELGRLALEKSEDPEVRRFSQHLIQDHTIAYQKLQPLALKHQVTLPREIDRAEYEEFEKLEGKSGDEFDQAFVKHILKAHSLGIAKAKKVSDKLEDPALKAYVTEMLPSLENHLEMARSAAKSVGLDDAAIAAAIQEGEQEAVGAPPGEPEVGVEQEDQEEDQDDQEDQDDKDDGQ